MGSPNKRQRHQREASMNGQIKFTRDPALNSRRIENVEVVTKEAWILKQRTEYLVEAAAADISERSIAPAAFGPAEAFSEDDTLKNKWRAAQAEAFARLKVLPTTDAAWLSTRDSFSRLPSLTRLAYTTRLQTLVDEAVAFERDLALQIANTYTGHASVVRVEPDARSNSAPFENQPSNCGSDLWRGGSSRLVFISGSGSREVAAMLELLWHTGLPVQPAEMLTAEIHSVGPSRDVSALVTEGTAPSGSPAVWLHFLPEHLCSTFYS